MKNKHEQKDIIGFWHHHGTTYVRMPLILFAGLIIALFAATLLLWSVKRKAEAVLKVKNPGQLGVLMPSLVGLTQGSLDPGNRVELLQNGDGFFPPLMR